MQFKNQYQQLKKDHRETHNDSQKTHSIKRIVNSGGGAKGAMYPGAYKAMINTGVIQGVEVFSGASAGAITSAFMAVGMSADILREKLLAVNFKNLMGSRIGGLKNPPGVCMITRDGVLLLDYIRECIGGAVKDSLREHRDTEDPELQKLLDKIKTENPRITFADLALLNALYPNKFKQLVVTAVKFPGGEVQVFNSTLTPDVEIALACRASASLPVILQPVEIEINGTKQQFVDGGIYDNLPTDFFDTDAQGGFSKNTIPNQTLVFAFGEGLDNKKNPVFQALYGQQWDHIISDELLEDLLNKAFRLCQLTLDKNEQLTAAEEAELLCHTVKNIIEQEVKNGILKDLDTKIFMNAIRETIHEVMLHPKENKSFWTQYKKFDNQKGRMGFLVYWVKEKIKPVLYQVDVFRSFKRNVLVNLLGDLTTPYKNTHQKELGYQKLRSEYALRTVKLDVGKVSGTDFNTATKLARTLYALGYLDTINYITNHDLHNPECFNQEQFYKDLVSHFEIVYTAALLGSGKDHQNDVLLKEIDSLRTLLKEKSKPEDVINRQVYQVIKDKVDQNMQGLAAFTLSRSVEFINKELTSEALFKEVYEESFKQSRLVSVSQITGESIFKSSSLHNALKNKNMFTLYKNQRPHEQQTRTDRVFEELSKLPEFDPEKAGPSSELHSDSINLS